MLRREHGEGSSDELSMTVRQIQLPGTFATVGRTDNFLSTSADYERRLRASSHLDLFYGDEMGHFVHTSTPSVVGTDWGTGHTGALSSSSWRTIVAGAAIAILTSLHQNHR